MARAVKESRICNSCGLEYFKLPSRKWITWRCLPCLSLYDKERRKLRGPAYRMWQGAKHRAKVNNIDFDITVDDIIVPEYCPVFGFKLNWYNETQANDSPSLDRKDNNKGYVKGNVQVISLKANRIKSDATLDELRSLVQYLTL